MKAEFERTELGYKAIFIKRLSYSAEKVWNTLTTPENLRNWLNVMNFEGTKDSTFSIEHDEKFQTKEIVNYIVPYTFEHTWWHKKNPEAYVRWIIDPQINRKGCELTLIYEGKNNISGSWGKDMAFWHTLIEFFTTYLEGIKVFPKYRPRFLKNGGIYEGKGEYARIFKIHEIYEKMIQTKCVTNIQYCSA